MINIGLGHYLALAAIIFTIGIVGLFLIRKNIIVILMSIELILLAVNINLVAFSIFLNDITGQIFTSFYINCSSSGGCNRFSDNSCLLPKLINN